MPAGDPQRTWFPQMIRRLRTEWHPEMSMEMIIDLRDQLDEMLHQIRRLGRIQTTNFTCPKCGKTGHSAQPMVSLRAMILALGRFQVAPMEQVKALEKAWARYREERKLGIEGKPNHRSG
jgi:hypothetical protein